MSTPFVIKSLFEFLAIMLLIVGLIYDDKVIAFEENVKRIVVGNFRRYMRIKNNKEAVIKRSSLVVHEGGKHNENPHKPFNAA